MKSGTGLEIDYVSYIGAGSIVHLVWGLAEK